MTYWPWLHDFAASSSVWLWAEESEIHHLVGLSGLVKNLYPPLCLNSAVTDDFSLNVLKTEHSESPNSQGHFIVDL